MTYILLSIFENIYINLSHYIIIIIDIIIIIIHLHIGNYILLCLPYYAKPGNDRDINNIVTLWISYIIIKT